MSSLPEVVPTSQPARRHGPGAELAATQRFNHCYWASPGAELATMQSSVGSTTAIGLLPQRSALYLPITSDKSCKVKMNSEYKRKFTVTFVGLAQSIQLEESTGCQNLVKR